MIVVSLIAYQYLGAYQAKASTDKFSNAIITNFIPSEFGEIRQNQAEELIEETLNQETVALDISYSEIKGQNPTLSASERKTLSLNNNHNTQLVIEMNPNKILALQNDASKLSHTNIQDNNENTDEETDNQSLTKRQETTTYTISAGDTVSSIAKKFGISVNTILWENNLSAYSVLKIGDTLRILPESGVSHTVARGESLSYLSNYYDVSVDEILSANNLVNANSLKIGQKLIMPGASRRSNVQTASTAKKVVQNAASGLEVIKELVKPSPAKADASNMLWPTEGHRITQYYSWKHKGLDIANKTGTPLYASEAGTVIYAGWSTGYGYNVLLDNGGGMRTRYAHASKLYVSKGDKVDKGETVAAMGSTGWSTGPHIHFEVIINGSLMNPLNYIK
ncbi:MAG: M23 family metallopeptidase [Candidatus Pacebacteria bacterium]|nr:M23 family metallopeptidase [Candidatus Paceibacterota bacterium]